MKKKSHLLFGGVQPRQGLEPPELNSTSAVFSFFPPIQPMIDRCRGAYGKKKDLDELKWNRAKTQKKYRITSDMPHREPYASAQCFTLGQRITVAHYGTGADPREFE